MALPQPLHIFRKDLIHLWPETLLVVLLFVACAWTAPSGWTASPFVGYIGLLSGFLKYFLMPVSWLVLISRLIQDESLVGDRQFWTSRPYHWATLFASKLLYLAVFLYLPFLVMQMYLLKHAGLYPTTALPALFHNLLLLTVIIVIPLTAISAVTGTFARMLLTTIGALVYVLALTIAIGLLSYQRLPPPQLQPLIIAIFILLPAAVLVYQYATRKTHISRIVLAAVPLVIFLLLLVTPAAALIRSSFPVAGSSEPKLGEIPDQYIPKAPRPGPLALERSTVPVTIPFTAANVDKDSNYVIQGASLTLTTADGFHYTTPFNAVGRSQINAGTPLAVVNVPIPLDVFNQIKSKPVDVHVSLAATHLKAEPAQTWKATLLPFAVPGHGICTYPPDNPEGAPTCRYPFKTPELNLVSAPMSVNSCTQSASPQPILGQAALGGLPGLLDFDPVVTTPLNLQPQPQVPPGYNFLLCPGTPLTFIEAREQGKTRFEFDAKGMILDNYAVHIAPAPSPRQQQAQPGAPAPE